MVAKILGKPLTFGDEEQISFIQKEEEKVKKYEKFSSDDLKEKYKELELEIGDIGLDIEYHQEEIRDLENKREEKEEEIEKIYKVLKDRGIFISKYERYKKF